MKARPCDSDLPENAIFAKTPNLFGVFAEYNPDKRDDDALGLLKFG